jgi:hypothetical protein
MDRRLVGHQSQSRRRREQKPFSAGNRIGTFQPIAIPIPVTLRDECKLKMFENKLPRKIFGPKRDEVGQRE